MHKNVGDQVLPGPAWEASKGAASWQRRRGKDDNEGTKVGRREGSPLPAPTANSRIRRWQTALSALGPGRDLINNAGVSCNEERQETWRWLGVCGGTLQRA